MKNFSKKDVVILCGGLGTRLRSVLRDTQKVMAPVGKRPFLDIILAYLQKQGFKRVILCLGFKSDEVEQYCKDSRFKMEFVFSKEVNPLGTGGALKNARPHIQTDDFFVLNGDSFCALDYGAFYSFHRKKKASVTIAVSRVEKSDDFGLIQLNASKKVMRFTEKAIGNNDQNGFVNAGVYCFNRKALFLMPPRERFSLEENFFPTLTGKDFFGFECQQEFIDIGTPDRYKVSKKKF